MTRALDVIEEYLDWRGFEFARLDGGTAAAERGQLIADFNSPGGLDWGLLLREAGRRPGCAGVVLGDRARGE